MQIDYKYIEKYYHRMAEDQITDQYKKMGYTVKREVPLGRFRADLVIENESEKIVIEIKTRQLRSEVKTRLKDIADYVKSLGDYKFRIAIAIPPKNKQITVDGIEDALLDAMNYSIPDNIDILATHSRIEEVHDVDIHTLCINGQEVNCIGEGVLDVMLQYGSDGDQARGDGLETTESFSFKFDVNLELEKNKIRNVDIINIDVDTSEF